MGGSSTLARLTIETAAAHRAIEDALFGPFDFPTTNGYRRFLCLLYGFQAPLEGALVLTPGIDLGFVDERCKAARIARDLMSIGLTRREFQLLLRRHEIAPFTHPAEALGWLYATERLTLQIEALRRQLARDMPVVFTLANQFIGMYQYAGARRWRDFGAMLDRVARDHGADAIVAAARDGIASLHAWLAANGAFATDAEVRASA